MMKILVISSEFPPGPGGLGSHAYSLCKSLRRNGHHLYVLSPGDYLGQQEIESFDHTQQFEIKRFKRKGFLTYPMRFIDTASVIRSVLPDEIFVSGKFPVWMIRWLKRKWPGLPVKVFLHGSETQLPQKWARWLFNRNLQKADVLYPVSRFTHNLIPEKIKNGHTFQIVPNGIDIDELRQMDNQTIPYTLQGNPCLLTIGNVTPRKGQHRVIRMLPDLIKRYPNLHYHMVGMPTHKMALIELAKKLGVSQYITFHGHIKDRSSLASYYKGCDIFIMLSENQKDGDVEGFGIAILEANYFGKPAIGARGCGIEQAICNNYNGILVDGDHAGETIRAISSLQEETEQYREQAYKWSMAHNWDNIVKDLHIES
jgi:phosphatidylinositol alpha-1,6-mannosyltransferase